VHEQFNVVDRFLDFIEDEGRCGDRVFEPARIDGDRRFRTESRVPFALKSRAGEDQREVDVEEDGTDAQSRSFD